MSEQQPPGGQVPPSGQQSYADAKAQAKAAKAYAKASRPWYRKKRWWFLAVVVLIVIIAVASSNGGDDSATTTGGTSGATATKKPVGPDTTDHKLTQAEFDSVKSGMAYKAFIQKYGKPDPDQTQTTEIQGVKDLTVYYDVEGGSFGSMYQFVFENGSLQSKSKY